MDWRWMVLIGLGVGTICLFGWFVFWKNHKFDASLLGLLTLGFTLIGIGVLQPPSIKWAGFELDNLKKQADEINKQAEDATKLALETSAMLTWNQGRFGAGLPNQEEVATKILKRIYGGKAVQFRYFLQHKGIYLTPVDELKRIPNEPMPSGIESPLYDKYLKGHSSKAE